MTNQQFSGYLQAKAKGFTTRKRKTMIIRENGRSTDFVAPGFATGCQLACSYCYVARHRDYGNPLEVYTNTEDIWKTIKTHYNSLGPKTPNQCDPTYWTYDIGESTDCLTPKVIKYTNLFINKFLTETDAKPSFATKMSVWKGLQPIKRLRQARIRVSLMPQTLADSIERLTSKIIDRIDSINVLYDMGFEVHVNFSPVIAYQGWVSAYCDLFKLIAQRVRPEVLDQLKCEVIFLTHNYDLDDSNKQWIPESSALLRTPNLQEYKTTLRGDDSVVRYSQKVKPTLIKYFKDAIAQYLPSCQIRYIF